METTTEIDEQPKTKKLKRTEITEEENPKVEKKKPQDKQTKCRPKKLVELIAILNEAQRAAVRDIGFGGLLELKLNELPHGILHRLLNAFDCSSHMFKTKKLDFLVSKHDVHDIFMLPRTGKQVIRAKKGDFKELKKDLRLQFGVTNTSSPISVKSVYDRMKASPEAGDEFKKMFFLYSMSVFLTPTTNKSIDLTLVKYVVDVGKIRGYDWCGYVFEEMTASIKKWKTNQVSNISGCILVVMLAYFHRFNFRGKCVPHTLPLIQHWDDKELSSRVKDEQKTSVLGDAPISKIEYPICLTQPEDRDVDLDEHEAENEEKEEYMLIKLPQGVKSNAELKAKVEDFIERYTCNLKKHDDDERPENETENERPEMHNDDTDVGEISADISADIEKGINVEAADIGKKYAEIIEKDAEAVERNAQADKMNKDANVVPELPVHIETEEEREAEKFHEEPIVVTQLKKVVEQEMTDEKEVNEQVENEKEVKEKPSSDFGSKMSVICYNLGSCSRPNCIYLHYHEFKILQSHVMTSNKNLLVLDVNGLLGDVNDLNKVHKRPFCDDFMKFCTEKFNVGIWSSRRRSNLNKALNSLMEYNIKKKLLFFWSQEDCTTVSHKDHCKNKKRYEYVFLKELSKLWDNTQNTLPWDKGFYNKTNTILLDDSPCKAMRNPPYTAVFPSTYKPSNKEDDFLGPRGKICLYLEKLANTKNVQKFIQENPFESDIKIAEFCH